MNKLFTILSAIFYLLHLHLPAQNIAYAHEDFLKNCGFESEKEKKKIVIYLAGKVPKENAHFDQNLHWTAEHMQHLLSCLSNYDIILLNPAVKDCDLNDQNSVFGRDMKYVSSSDFIFVDARGSRGLGVGSEMMWAKVHGIPVVTWAPKDTYYNKSATVVLNTNLPAFIHPFVNGLSDQIVENIDEGALWIRKCIDNPNNVKIKNTSDVYSAIEYFEKIRRQEVK